ncbi:MAG: PadR family transcriptional regulator [Candidatus Aenigmarchaeota archaeon]|nr:PadR family transcriptional regulator [Candidatus Aenigmarchaeota archaeon]
MRTPSQRFETSITKDNLWIYILTLLKKKELYTYELNSKVLGEFGFSPGNVTAYIVLQRLKADGYVRASSRRKEGGPIRHYYGITDKGIAELRKARAIYAKYGRYLC